MSRHTLSIWRDAKGLVSAGLDVIAHSIRDQDVDAAFIAELKRRNIGYIPTLTRDLSVFQYESTPDYINDPFFLRGHAGLRAADRARQGSRPAREDRRRIRARRCRSVQLDQGLRNLKLLSDGGVMIAMGTDSGTGLGRWQGYFEQVEMELMVKAGMTPMQTLVASTGNAAKVMRPRQGSRHAAAGQARRLRGADRRPARRHQEHADD